MEIRREDMIKVFEVLQGVSKRQSGVTENYSFYASEHKTKVDSN